MKYPLIALALISGAWAQVPNISGIKIDSLDTTSFRVFFTVDSGAWSEVVYGTASGVYPYNTKSINCYKTTAPCQTAGGPSSLLVTGLAPATTYYVRVTARPDPNDDINICNTNACGSTEQTVTTLSGDQPAPPILPAAWYPAAPDTTGYTVIPLQSGNNGECQAARAVRSADGWQVRMGDTVGVILSEIGYGAVLELGQGLACMVPPNTPGANPGTGYILPSKSLDSNAKCVGQCSMTDPNHRWIVFRTHENNPGDFPPFGARIDPSFAAKLGKFYSAQPNHFAQLFEAENSAAPVHHIWWQNVEFEDDPQYTNPQDSVDPIGFQYFVQVGSQYQNANNQFLVFDRVYAHGPGAPVRHLDGMEFGGNYQAMIGCYLAQVEAWRMTAWPSNSGSLDPSGKIITVPINNYRLAAGSAMLGMTSPALVTLNAAGGAGGIVGNLYKDHLEVQFAPSGGTITCSGCTATQASSPATPPNAFQLFSATVGANGQFSGVNWNTQEWQTSQYAMAFGVMFSDLKAPGGPYLFENNYISGVGEGFYIDAQYSNFANDDITFTHNHQIWPKNYFGGDPANQWRYEVRQHWEIKRGHRFLIQGNLFSYSWSFQNDGPAVFLSGRPTYVAQTQNDGISDITIQSNTVSHGRTGIECQNGDPMDNGGGNMEPAPTKRVVISNNLMFDLGRWKYCDSVQCPGLSSFYFENRPGCQDLVISNNTADVSWGDLPSLIYLGGGELLGNQLTFEKNILHFSLGNGGLGGGNFGDWPPNNVANHDVRPAPVFVNQGSAVSFKNNFAQAISNSGASVEPHYNWGNNVLIGGFTGATLASAVDMSYSQVTALASTMPAGDTYPVGDTIAARRASAGLNPATWRSTIYNPLGIGADIDALTAAMGIVKDVAPVAVGDRSGEFQYTAPDAKACAVDVSADGVSWIRTNDQGGGRARTRRVLGLTPATKYAFRILCYFTQENDGILYTDYTPDQITTGTFTTHSGPAQ